MAPMVKIHVSISGKKKTSVGNFVLTQLLNCRPLAQSLTLLELLPEMFILLLLLLRVT